MNNKKIIILTVAFIAMHTTLLSQNVIVELKTHWATEYNCLNDTIGEVPYLDVIYKNNTGQDVYFVKVCESFVYPDFSDVTMMNYVDKHDDDFIKKRAMRYLSYTSCYNVYVGDIWTIYDTVHNPEFDLITDEFINSDVYYIYEWMKQQNPNICILDSCGNDTVNTVFLKSGDSYTDSYNIAPLLINNGMYIFKIDGVKYNHKYAIAKYRDNCKDRGIPAKQKLLPERIGNFRRYDGEIIILETKLDLKNRFQEKNR